jgi:hypothetical protein
MFETCEREALRESLEQILKLTNRYRQCGAFYGGRHAATQHYTAASIALSCYRDPADGGVNITDPPPVVAREDQHPVPVILGQTVAR